MFVNVAPTPVNFDGRLVLLQSPSPEGLSALVQFIRESKKTESNLITVARDVMASGLTGEAAKVAIEIAVKLDHEERIRTKFIPAQEVDPGQFMDPKIVAMLLHVLAVAKQPDMDLNECNRIVGVEGFLTVLAKISLAFPKDPEKKDQALLDWLSGGVPSTGQPNAPN